MCRALPGLPEVLEGKEARLFILLRLMLTKSQVALKHKGIDRLVEEAREDNRDSDATHMRRR